MTFKALEVSVNSKKLFTVGHQHWHLLEARVSGHRFPPEMFSMEQWPEGEPMPTEPIEGVDLHCSFAIPREVNDPEAGRLSSESYDQHKLEVGDEITIRIVETSQADESNGPQDGPHVVVGKE